MYGMQNPVITSSSAHRLHSTGLQVQFIKYRYNHPHLSLFNGLWPFKLLNCRINDNVNYDKKLTLKKEELKTFVNRKTTM
jgi:hypothetical protein